MIFARYPEKGKVKTRLAAGVGEEQALKIYAYLLEYTFAQANAVAADKAVFMPAPVKVYPPVERYGYPHFIQKGNDLGEKMHRAFMAAFEQGYNHAIIIGSDCREITPSLIKSAFDALSEVDCVIGPASDGGYYLIGLNNTQSQLFLERQWSTPDVFLDTLLDLQKLGMSYRVLETLNDVDTAADLGTWYAEIFPEKSQNNE